MDEISGKWYVETIFPDLAVMLRVQEVLYSGKTEYQNVEVLESAVFGRSLVLDGKTQSTERDEHIYHEALVHPSMLMHPQPRTVFIGGGGEGGTLREVLSHHTVERVVMVDLDREVVDLCAARLKFPQAAISKKVRMCSIFTALHPPMGLDGGIGFLDSLGQKKSLFK